MTPPRFAVSLRGEPVWVGLLADGEGGVKFWIDGAIDPPLDDYEIGRLERLAEEELLRRQHEWRARGVALRLRPRLAAPLQARRL